MGFLSKLFEGFRYNRNDSNDDYFLDDGYYDEEEDYEDNSSKGGFFSGRNSQDSGNQKSGGLFGNRAKVVQVPTAAMQVSMKRPKNIDDSADICDDLLDGMAVVINLEGISQDQAQRIIDFTYGAVYSIDGELKMVSKYIFMASPHSVALSGDFVGDFNMKGSSSSYQDNSRAAAGSGRGGYGFNG